MAFSNSSIENPLFSIVVPTYNRADLISKTLKTLSSQSLNDWEIIIVDDGSTDNTESIIQEYINNDNIKYFFRNNSERAAARNFGASIARGQYVNFFDSDDWALPHYLEIARKLIHERNSPNWFLVNYEIVNSSGVLMKPKLEFEFEFEIINLQLKYGNLLSCSSVFINREIFIQHKFNEDRDLSASEDYELWLRLAARYPLYCSKEVGCQLVDHPQRSVRKINIVALRKRIYLLIKYSSSDEMVVKFFKFQFKEFQAGLYAYLALHLSDLSRYKLFSIFFLLKIFILQPKFVFKRNFAIICRNIFLRWN
jgi:glycosyltransferase involved in cell wall biosynthesis